MFAVRPLEVVSKLVSVATDIYFELTFKIGGLISSIIVIDPQTYSVEEWTSLLVAINNHEACQLSFSSSSIICTPRELKIITNTGASITILLDQEPGSYRLTVYEAFTSLVTLLDRRITRGN